MRVSVGRTALASSNSVKLVHDIDLDLTEDARDDRMLIVQHDQAVAVQRDSTKKLVMKIVAKYAMEADSMNKKKAMLSHKKMSVSNTGIKNNIDTAKETPDNRVGETTERINTESIYAIVNKKRKHDKHEEHKKADRVEYESVS